MKRVQRWQRSAFVVILFGLTSACASTSGPKRSTLQQRVGQPGGLGVAELRLWVYEMPPQLAGMVETAADQIRAESSDYAVERRALLWKADGIPTLYTAALRPDPLAGALFVRLDIPGRVLADRGVGGILAQHRVPTTPKRARNHHALLALGAD